jgi:hypothetical protein
VSTKNRLETLVRAFEHSESTTGAPDDPEAVATYLEAHGWEYRYEPSKEEIEAYLTEHSLYQKNYHESVWRDIWSEAREKLLFKAGREEYGR